MDVYPKWPFRVDVCVFMVDARRHGRRTLSSLRSLINGCVSEPKWPFRVDVCVFMVDARHHGRRTLSSLRSPIDDVYPKWAFGITSDALTVDVRFARLARFARHDA